MELITIQSAINFKEGQIVKINPQNHGYKHLNAYLKIKDRKGVVVKVEVAGNIDKRTGQFSYGLTGRLTVKWDGDPSTKIVKCKNLIIID